MNQKIFAMFKTVLTSFNPALFQATRAREFILLALCVFMIVMIQQHPRLTGNAVKEFAAPPPQMEHFVFGFQESTADLLWIRAIQDFDYCEHEVVQKKCAGQGWLYQMLSTIMNLSPHFRMPAATGGLALTVLVNDMEGASKIFDRATQAFPEDWVILYRASYHALFEEKDKPKAARLLERAAHHGGPEWFYQLSSRLYTEAGEREFAQKMFEEIKNSDVPPAILAVIQERLRQ